MSLEHAFSKNTSLELRVGYLQPFNSLFNRYNIQMDGKKNGMDWSLQYRYFFDRNATETLREPAY